MTPVDMAVLMDHVEAGGADAAVNDGAPAGDCLRACVATLLSMDLDEVPHFVQYIDHPDGTDPLLWWWALIGFLVAHASHVEWIDDKDCTGWSIATGLSPRGHQHAVVYHDGALIHDPHPSRSGLLDVEGHIKITTHRGAAP